MKKNILVGVSGGVACYKTITLVSMLRQNGYDVRVAMTKHAAEFVTPLTFQALSRNEVYTDSFQEKNPKEIVHINLAKWADAVILAPATANLIGKMANGIADDLLSTLMLVTRAPIFLAPAMNVAMYTHPVVIDNLEKLSKLGVTILEGESGFQACGDFGKGRMMEPDQIYQFVDGFFNKGQVLAGKKVLVTAGPTVEQIDPVRFISNYSSGKMGYAIAEAAVQAGAEVTLVSGPTHLAPPKSVDFVQVTSADQMFEQVRIHFENADIIVKSAAVADYTPMISYHEKQKKTNENWNIELKKTTDILSWLGQNKKKQVLVGFAAETQDVINHAKDKLSRKNLDLIVVNDVSKPNVGFSHDTNEVTLIYKTGDIVEVPLQSKQGLAKTLVEKISEMLGD